MLQFQGHVDRELGEFLLERRRPYAGGARVRSDEERFDVPRIRRSQDPPQPPA